MEYLIPLIGVETYSNFFTHTSAIHHSLVGMFGRFIPKGTEKHIDILCELSLLLRKFAYTPLINATVCVHKTAKKFPSLLGRSKKILRRNMFVANKTIKAKQS